MLEEIEFDDSNCLEGYDRTFLNYSSKLAEPFCWAYGMLRHRFVSPLDPNKFDNTSSKIKEIATRIFIFACATVAFACAATHLAFAAVVLGSCSKLFRAIGFALQKDHFTHVKGLLPEQALVGGQAKVMTWKISGEYGGLHYRQGGVVHWRSRLDQIVENIKAQNPDILVLQAVKDTALSEALIERLKDHYAHFFTQMGGGTWENINGCLVMSKCAIAHFAYHQTTPETSFETFEVKVHPDDLLPSVRFVATELIAGKENQEKRMEQVARIVDHLAKQTLPLPALLIGNNADQDDAVEGTFFSQYLYPSYREKEPTRTDQLALQWDPQFKGHGDTYAFISLFKRNLPDGRTLPVIEKGIRLISCRVVKGFDETFDTKTALSPDHGIVTTFDGLYRS